MHFRTIKITSGTGRDFVLDDLKSINLITNSSKFSEEKRVLDCVRTLTSLDERGKLNAFGDRGMTTRAYVSYEHWHEPPQLLVEQPSGAPVSFCIAAPEGATASYDTFDSYDAVFYAAIPRITEGDREEIRTLIYKHFLLLSPAVNFDYKVLDELDPFLKRLLCIGLLFVYAKCGVVTIRGLEDGIHYGEFANLAAYITALAYDYRVQVFCTTRSKECVDEFVAYARDISFYAINAGAAYKYTQKELATLIEATDFDLRG